MTFILFAKILGFAIDKPMSTPNQLNCKKRFILFGTIFATPSVGVVAPPIRRSGKIGKDTTFC